MLLFFLALATGTDADGPLRVQADPKDPRQVAVVATLPAAAALPQGGVPREQAEPVLRLSVIGPDGKPGPAIFGRYERRDGVLTFRPRYPLLHGHHYQAVFAPPGGRAVSVDHAVPPRPPTPPAVVEKIYPTADVLPANHLKFYIYFSDPMQGGKEIFDQIYLADDRGARIEAAWLMDELWDADGKRLILYIHPGRIKWGLLLREMLGPVLLPDRRYTLVVSGALLDLNGQPLGKDYRYSFRTTAENRKRIELSDVQVTRPRAGTTAPLKLLFPEPIDHGSLRRFLHVVDAGGNAVEGSVAPADGERGWGFTPAAAWKDDAYAVVVSPELEDCAGNTPLRPFDLDLAETQPEPQALTIRFRPVGKQG